MTRSIELHPFFSRKDSLEFSDFSVIDIDPDDHVFDDVVDVALQVCAILEDLDVEYFVKTSGATGIHVIVPFDGATFSDSLNFASGICLAVQKEMVHLTTVERSRSKRGGRIYLDALQNRRSSTIASVYSLRPTKEASVSMPLRKDELVKGLSPSDFNIDNTLSRLRDSGDLFQDLYSKRNNFIKVLESMKKKGFI